MTKRNALKKVKKLKKKLSLINLKTKSFKKITIL